MLWRWCWPILRFFLFLLPAETAHHLAMHGMRAMSAMKRKRSLATTPRSSLALDAMGMHFRNPIGLAAGLDKGDVVFEAMFELGFGFVEIGTITPRPQAGNPRPRLFRLKEHHALINRMGFNNPGAEAVAARLARAGARRGPVWLNIGKNKDTPNDDAVSDYLSAMRTLYRHGDAFVINVSSPNTPGLRDLQSEDKLGPLLEALQKENATLAQREGMPLRPMLLKLSPDVADESLPHMVACAERARLSGIIATNTTLARPVTHALTSEAGGFSGPALKPRADAVLQSIHAVCGDRMTLVGVGGIETAQDVRDKFARGARLVEVYTSFIYGGPGYVQRLLRALDEEHA